MRFFYLFHVSYCFISKFLVKHFQKSKELREPDVVCTKLVKNPLFLNSLRLECDRIRNEANLLLLYTTFKYETSNCTEGTHPELNLKYNKFIQDAYRCLYFLNNSEILLMKVVCKKFLDSNGNFNERAFLEGKYARILKFYIFYKSIIQKAIDEINPHFIYDCVDDESFSEKVNSKHH